MSLKRFPARKTPPRKLILRVSTQRVVQVWSKQLNLKLVAELGNTAHIVSHERYKQWGSQRFVSRSLRVSEARQYMSGSEFLQGGPKKPLCETVKIKCKLQWRYHDDGDARTVEHHLIKKAAGVKWILPSGQVVFCRGKRFRKRTSEALWSPHSSITRFICLTGSWRIWCLPCCVSFLSCPDPSLLCPYSSLLEQECLLCAIICGKYVALLFIYLFCIFVFYF